ncbi:MAG TPA: four-helix bundle copper-binding protein [Phycisphaerales bacterium]|nr:four-helix bundle copper-binding protein [Phycisphaerales bacterium]
MPHHEPTREMRQCIGHCQECAALCVECGTHCLRMGGDHAAPEHQGLLHDCADVCAAAARFMLRSSHHHSHVCGLCAEVCEACAEECERLAEGDQLMTRCAEACRRCARSCRQMAGAGV